MLPARRSDVTADRQTRNAESPAQPPLDLPSIRVLHVSKSVVDFSYHESLIRHLCERGHSVHAIFEQGYGDHSLSTGLHTFAQVTDRFSAGGG